MLGGQLLSRSKALASTSLAADIRSELFGGPSGTSHAGRARSHVRGVVRAVLSDLCYVY